MITDPVAAKAYTVFAAEPVPVNGSPATIRTSPDCGESVIGLACWTAPVPPNCIVSNTGEVEVLLLDKGSPKSHK